MPSELVNFANIPVFETIPVSESDSSLKETLSYIKMLSQKSIYHDPEFSEEAKTNMTDQTRASRLKIN